MQEAKELANDPSTDYSAAPLEVDGSRHDLPTHLIPLVLLSPGRYLCKSGDHMVNV